MATVGLLVLLVLAGLTIDLVVESSSAPVKFFGFTLHINPGWLLVAGAAILVLAGLGVTLVGSGIRKARRRRAELREQNRTAEQLRTQRDDLASQLAQERAEHQPDSPEQPK